MQTLASNLENLPIISLQTGEMIARAREPIVELATLEVAALGCEILRRRGLQALLLRDIRQLSADCLIIDDEDELTDPGDIVRLTKLLEVHFHPLGKPVVTDLGRRLGNVDDYVINLSSCRIQKLYLRRPGLRAWLSSDLTVDRSQIIDVTPKQIVVRDSTVTSQALSTEAIPETSR